MGAHAVIRPFDGMFVDSASFSTRDYGAIWENAHAMQAWIREHGQGAFYWHVAHPEWHGERRLRFLFEDEATAVAFKLRWG